MKKLVNSNGKFRHVYLLTSAGMVEQSFIACRFLQCKMNEYEDLRLEIKALSSELGARQVDGRKTANK